MAIINSGDFSKGGFISSSVSSEQGRAKIVQSLQEFARQNGIDLLLDESTIGSALFITNDDVDVTDAFISDFNRKNSPNAAGSIPNVLVPGGKIALIDTEAFSDEKLGVRRLVAAYKQVDAEFQPRRNELQQMQNRLNSLSGSSKDTLQREFNQKRDQAQNDWNRRIQEVAGPIQDDVSKALSQFARQNGITIVLDISKFSPVILTSTGGADITTAFITAYNNANSAAAINVPSIAVPDLKLAVINTDAFSDAKTGIIRYVNAMNALNKEFEPRSVELQGIQKKMNDLKAQIQQQANTANPRDIQQMQDQVSSLERELKYKSEDSQAAFSRRYNEVVGPIQQDMIKALDAFVKQRGLTLILDESKLATGVLAESNSLNVTRDFINDYNQHH